MMDHSIELSICPLFTCGRRLTGHRAIPVVVVFVGGEKLFSKIEKRGVPLHSEIIVGNEPPFLHHPVAEVGGSLPILKS